jgi:hypothetical protein
MVEQNPKAKLRDISSNDTGYEMSPIEQVRNEGNK